MCLLTCVIFIFFLTLHNYVVIEIVKESLRDITNVNIADLPCTFEFVDQPSCSTFTVPLDSDSKPFLYSFRKIFFLYCLKYFVLCWASIPFFIHLHSQCECRIKRKYSLNMEKTYAVSFIQFKTKFCLFYCFFLIYNMLWV